MAPGTGIVQWQGETAATIHKATLNVNAGLARLDKLAGQFDERHIREIGELARQTGLVDRSVVILGAGELGLMLAQSLILSRAVKGVVAFFHEPEAFMNNQTARNAQRNYFPIARSENALALRLYGERFGIPVLVDDADLLIATGVDTYNPLPEGVTDMVAAMGNNPLYFNAVAFARYKGPMTADVPPPPPQASLDAQGRIILMDVPKFDQEAVATTLQTMGYNDSALRSTFKEKGLVSDLGAALIWDLPAFFSGALGAIAGGFGLYFPERKVLEDKGVFKGTNILVPEGLIGTLGGGWVRPDGVEASWIFPTWPGGSRHSSMGLTPGIYFRGALGGSKSVAEIRTLDWNRQHISNMNEMAVIQLDMAERLYAGDIQINIKEFERRIAAYREAHPEAKFPPSVEESHRILMEPFPIVSANYQQVLSVLREPDEVPAPVVVSPVEATPIVDAPAASPLRQISASQNQAYSAAVGDTLFGPEGLAHPILTFYADLAEMADKVGLFDPSKSVIHAKETIYYRPLAAEREFTIGSEIKTKSMRGSDLVTRTRTYAAANGTSLGGGSTLLMVSPAGKAMPEARPGEVKDWGTLVGSFTVTGEFIDTIIQTTGDNNPVHVSDEDAKPRGLPGRILHGLATGSLGLQALLKHAEDSGSPILVTQGMTITVTFKGIVRPGDTLRYFVPAGKSEVVIVNQNNVVVAELKVSPLA